MAEPPAAGHLLAVRAGELFHRAQREAELPLAVAEHPPRLEAEQPPPGHRFGGHVEPLAHLLQAEHRLGRQLDGEWRERPLQPADHGRQVVLEVAAGDEQVRVRGGSEVGHPEADELVRVDAIRHDLGQQLLGRTGAGVGSIRHGSGCGLWTQCEAVKMETTCSLRTDREGLRSGGSGEGDRTVARARRQGVGGNRSKVRRHALIPSHRDGCWIH